MKRIKSMVLGVVILICTTAICGCSNDSLSFERKETAELNVSKDVEDNAEGPQNDETVIAEAESQADITEPEKENKDEYMPVNVYFSSDGRAFADVVNMLTVKLDEEPFDGQKVVSNNGIPFEVKLVKDNPIVQKYINNEKIKAETASVQSYPQFYLIVEGCPVEDDEYLFENSPYFYILGKEKESGTYELIYIVPYNYELMFGYCWSNIVKETYIVDENVIINLCPYTEEDSSCYWNSEFLERVAGGNNRSIDEMREKLNLLYNSVGAEYLQGYAKMSDGKVVEFIESHIDNY